MNFRSTLVLLLHLLRITCSMPVIPTDHTLHEDKANVPSAHLCLQVSAGTHHLSNDSLRVGGARQG